MTLGTMATDVEQRIDFDALRAYRLGRAREQLKKHDFGAYLCFDLDNIRYITGTALAEWTRGKWVRWCVLPREGDLVLWEKSSAAAVKRRLCPWIKPENIRTSIEWKHGANPHAVTLSQIAKDFGISETCLHRWIKRAEIEDGVREGLTLAEEAEIRELRKRNRLLEQENEVLRRAAIYLGQGVNPK